MNSLMLNLGVVSYVEHPAVIFLCHAYVKESHRESLKYFINNGYGIEKALFKVVKM